jgi:hypothetical protein
MYCMWETALCAPHTCATWACRPHRSACSAVPPQLSAVLRGRLGPAPSPLQHLRLTNCLPWPLLHFQLQLASDAEAVRLEAALLTLSAQALNAQVPCQ